MGERRSVLLVQLPIPPVGPGEIEGNTPLAGAYLKLFARRRGLDRSRAVELLPASLCNTLGDRALVAEILERRPTLVCFSCYMWNVERSLWIARQLKQHRPEIKIAVGGPEITADNRWVLDDAAIDCAVIGEGEAAFGEVLAEDFFRDFGPEKRVFSREASDFSLDEVSSPYVEGILDLSDGRMLLETARGCRFRCKYCYYPKNHAVSRFLSREQIAANVRYAAEQGADEIFLLDPTLNQRADFSEFLGLLAECNSRGRLKFSGELRAEGIDAATAELLKKANFHEVEIGLQSVEPAAWRLMGRGTDLEAFRRGVAALTAEGIKVCVDLIVGLPGDTEDSVRRGIEFLLRTKAYSQAQMFNLSILPGTAFRREAKRLGVSHQPWPPYYALKTPTLDVERMLLLMEEAQEAFGVEFDAMPGPRFDVFDDPRRGCRIDLDAIGDGAAAISQVSASSSLCFAFWFRSADFRRHRRTVETLIERFLTDNPHTTLQIIFEPAGDPRHLTSEILESALAVCYRRPTYLDRYYSLHPGSLLGSKRLFVLLPSEEADEGWIEEISERATVVSKTTTIPKPLRGKHVGELFYPG